MSGYMSKAFDRIGELIKAAGEQPDNEYEFAQSIIKVYLEEGCPEDCKDYYVMASAYSGKCLYNGWDGLGKDAEKAFEPLHNAYLGGNKGILEELGMCYFNGWGTPADENKAATIWKEGLDLGDKACALHYYVWQVDNDKADELTVQGLESLVNDHEDPNADACAVLYQYFSNEGDEDKAWEWREKGLDMGSELMQNMVDEEKEEEVGEDSWTASDNFDSSWAKAFFPEDEDDDDDEYEGHDDETEAAHPGYPDVGEKYVIIAATDDSFRIVQADASDWRSLPALIGADSCDDMRCEKFRKVSKALHLPGTLLGQLDKDGFRKSYLRRNWHASQWYDGMADLLGAMVICMEDGRYNPFSFSSREEAQKAIDALCK